MSLGAIISPASMGLYSLYYVGGLIGFIGLFGFASTFLHSWPGYYIALAINLIPEHTVVEGVQRFYVEGCNALVWSIVYGLLGMFMDYLGTKSEQPAA
jgi:hypothetical protein